MRKIFSILNESGKSDLLDLILKEHAKNATRNNIATTKTNSGEKVTVEIEQGKSCQKSKSKGARCEKGLGGAHGLRLSG
jgi:hypothetical protein